MATPTLRVIRNRFSEARITFLIESNVRDLVRGGDWLDECLEWPDSAKRKPWNKEYRRLVHELRDRALDLAVILPNSFRAALIARLSGARRRIGYDRDGRGWLLTDRVPVRNRRTENLQPPMEASFEESNWRMDRIPDRSGGRYRPVPLVEYYADLVEVLGCARPGHEFELFTTAEEDDRIERRLSSLGFTGGRPLVVLSPGAKYGAAKCWPVEKFAAAADCLVESDDAAVLITCGPGEEPIAREIGGLMRKPHHVLDDPRLTLGELKSLIRRCDLLLCNDAGPRHFAKAFNVSVVTVFGPTHPAWTATKYPLERILRIDVDCGPCQQRICPLGHLKCMNELSVESVAAACRELLQQRLAMTAR